MDLAAEVKALLAAGIAKQHVAHVTDENTRLRQLCAEMLQVIHDEVAAIAFNEFKNRAMQFGVEMPVNYYRGEE